MTQSSNFLEACKYIVGGVNSPVRSFKGLDLNPIFIDYGHGPYLFSTDCKQYLDFCLSWGSLILGHTHPVVIDAVKKVLLKGTSFGMPTVLETQMAKTICTIMPSIELIRFVNSGTEAVMTAIKLARAFTKREKILKFDGCYHGHYDPMLVSAGSGVSELPKANSSGIDIATISKTLSIPFNDIEALEKVIFENKSSLAALIIEPVPANMGVIIPKNGYLKAIRELTEKYKIVLIFDEVITGFRLGLNGAQGMFNIKPDLTCLGKIIGGGFPVGAVGGRKDIMLQLAPVGTVYQAGTLSGNPVAMAAGLATINYLKDNPDIYSRLEKIVKNFADEWKLKFDLTINAIGSMFTIFYTQKPVENFFHSQTQDFDLFKNIFIKLIEKGIFLPPSMYETAFISTEHTKNDLDKLISLFSTFFKRKKIIHIRYTSMLQEQCGISEETVYTDALNVAELFDELCKKYSFRFGCGMFKVIINDKMQSLTSKLQDGDIVTFLPPIGGG